MIYRFGSSVLDTRRRELLTPEGPVPLRPKVFSLLAYLIERRERVVSKQELFEQLWPDVTVGEATLSTCIKAARQAVGDSGKAQKVIRTWHGHGFRFVAPVVEQSDGDAGEAFAGESGAMEPQGETQSEPPLEVAAPSVPVADAGAVVPLDAFPSGKEHKQVTVLHCALPEASRLAARLGPEAMHETMERFMAEADGIVQRYGGTVTQWLGDGFVALFGAPRAFEDHGRRAVSASLELLARLAGDREPLAVRIGLHTGPVIVGSMARDPGRIYTAAGETTETAKALQTIAPPGAILASEACFAMVQAEVDAEPFEAGRSAGSEAPPLHLIRGLIARQAGVPRRGGRLPSRFVGRERELAILRGWPDSLSEGGGQVVCVSGEPGIGKSRLIDEFEHSLAGDDIVSYRVNCLSYAASSPYLVVRRLLRQICGIRSSDPNARALDKLEERLRKAGLDAALARALLGELLELPVELPDPGRLEPDQRRVQTFDQLYAVVASVCAAQPCMIVVEDLHWIDATSEAWLTGLALRLAGLRLMLLVSYRPGYQAPWLRRSSVTQLALSGLRSEVSAKLVRSVPTSAPLSDRAMRSIVAKAQGNPFFLEELAWALGSGRDERLGTPETIQAVLTDRIDRLEPQDKRLLQIAAVIGPEVSLPLLAAADGMSDGDRRQALLRLQEAEFLYERQLGSTRVFTFKHALTQDVAYMSLVARTRAAIHRRIAEALKSGLRSLVRIHPEILAHHLTESGDPEQAVGYWLQAGRRAVERSANAEAIAHLTKGLELLEALPESAERDEREIELQLALGVSLLSTKGPGSPETERAYRRASGLSRARGDRLSLFLATWGLWRVNSASAEMRACRDLAGVLVSLAQDQKDPALSLQAHHANWTTLYIHGEFAAAESHIERGLALYDPQEHRYQASLVAGHDPGVCAHLTAARILWAKGYPDQAEARAGHARVLAEELDHPSSLAFALNHALRSCVRYRDPESVKQWQEPLRALAREYGFLGHAAWCDLVQVWLDAQQRGSAEGIAEMRRLRASRPDLAGFGGAYAQAILADACRAAGRAAEGLSVLDETPASDESGGPRFWDAELDRLRGELLLLLGADRQAEAEACFGKAITIARRQNARSLELRSTTSLARLRCRQGRPGEGLDLLAPVYAWFTEGHGTPDLLEASALLDSLSG